MDSATNTHALLDQYMALVFTIMVSAGLLAGIANFFLSEARSGRELAKYVVLGIVAALTVPLFLNMTSSNLLDFGRSRPLSLFVFSGFCLVYVLLSRRIFESIASRLMQLGQKRGDSMSMAGPLVSTNDFFRAGLSKADLDIMRAVAQGGSVYDNLAEVAAEAPPAKDYVNDRLALMRSLGLLELRTNEQNVLHMCLSPNGSHILAEASTGAQA